MSLLKALNQKLEENEVIRIEAINELEQFVSDQYDIENPTNAEKDYMISQYSKLNSKITELDSVSHAYRTQINSIS